MRPPAGLARVTSPAMDVEVAFTGVPVSELPTARDFYERFFGRPADVVVHENEEMWRLSDAAWVYVVVDPARAGRALAMLSVADLDATLAELARRGIRPDRLEEYPGPARKATVLDPDGNSVAVGQIPA